MEKSFLYHIEQSIRNNWDLPSLTDYKGKTYYYRDVAIEIARLHLYYEQIGIKKGDKIALCGRNSSHWGIAFISVLTYGAVAVPLLHEFKPDNIHHLVNHSDAKILIVGDMVWEGLNEKEMHSLSAILLMNTFQVISAKEKQYLDLNKKIDLLFKKRYPRSYCPKEVIYHHDQPEDLALINYTSGTTSSPKGVMLPYRSLWSNLRFAIDTLGYCQGESLVSMLPMAHMYGLAFEFIYQFAGGAHVYFLTRIPSPKIILEAFAEVKPNLIITVPLVIEKVIKKQVFPIIGKPAMKFLLHLPLINDIIYEKIKEKVVTAFGGNFKEIVIGGASFNPDVEEFLRRIKFPYTVGYGMTECGPLLSYDGWATTKATSCGKCIPRMEMKIHSSDPHTIPGEILFKGANVMLGYYKNTEATAQAIDKEGWLHTGDLGVIDPDGYIFIKGRSKNMILGPSGQNIYPEEIENKINNLSYVSESLVIEKEGKLIALIYPDFEQLDKDNILHDQIPLLMEENRKELNQGLPAYSPIHSVKIYYEEFEKTPKRSIKRFLYQ